MSQETHHVAGTVYRGRTPEYAEFCADDQGQPVSKALGNDRNGYPVAVYPGYIGRTVWLKTRKGQPFRRVTPKLEKWS